MNTILTPRATGGIDLAEARRKVSRSKQATQEIVPRESASTTSRIAFPSAFQDTLGAVSLQNAAYEKESRRPAASSKDTNGVPRRTTQLEDFGQRRIAPEEVARRKHVAKQAKARQEAAAQLKEALLKNFARREEAILEENREAAAGLEEARRLHEIIRGDNPKEETGVEEAIHIYSAALEAGVAKLETVRREHVRQEAFSLEEFASMNLTGQGPTRRISDAQQDTVSFEDTFRQDPAVLKGARCEAVEMDTCGPAIFELDAFEPSAVERESTRQKAFELGNTTERKWIHSINLKEHIPTHHNAEHDRDEHHTPVPNQKESTRHTTPFLARRTSSTATRVAQ